MTSRSTRAGMARETVSIIEQGSYLTGRGTRIDIAANIAASVAGTVEYGPGADLPNPPPAQGTVRVRVEPVGTFEAAHQLREHNPVALNFASAKHPGGGFLNGAQAQEEALARDSTLYGCIRSRQMYRNPGPDALYTHAMIYSPGVVVFRGPDGTLLEDPWLTSVVTAAAPNAGVVLGRDPSRSAEVADALRERARRVLAVAHAHGHRHLVLGAWGCGVFRNDPAQVAHTFRDLLEGPFAGVFDLAVFAVLDHSPKRHVLAAFRRVMGDETP